MPSPVLPPKSPETKEKGNWFRRKVSEVKREAEGEFPVFDRDRRDVKEGDLRAHQAMVTVEAREVSFRTVTELGLYDTVAVRAIVVVVVVGS